LAKEDLRIKIMPISTRQLLGSTLALLAIGFIALLAIVAANIWLNERAQIYADEVIRVRDLKSFTVDLRAAVQTAESSQRGYLYTGNEIYLAPYDLARSRAVAGASQLDDQTADYPLLADAVARLRGSIAEKVSGMDVLIRLKKESHEAEALQLVRTNNDKFLMDEINMLLTGISLAADQHLSELLSEQQSNAAWLRLVSIGGGAVILAAAGLAVLAITTYMRDLNAARRELKQSNEFLEQRVHERTAQLATTTDNMRAARDRAEMLLAEVNHRVANSLALVISLIGIQMRSAENTAAKSALDETRARVQAIAQAHKRLYEGQNVQQVALNEYLAGIIDQFKLTAEAEGGIHVRYELEPLHLSTDASISLGVILSEWILNAFKYAYPNGLGEVRVRLATTGAGQGTLQVEDDGVGRSETAQAKGTGLGTKIASAMAANMSGKIEYEARSAGTCAKVIFPLPEQN
jgi:two-component sensor histidine kinase